MSLQKQVNRYPDFSIEGSLYRDPVEATAGLASLDTVVGRGVFSSVTQQGILSDHVSNVKGNGLYAGIAYRSDESPNFDIRSKSSMVVPQGFEVSILNKGSIWVAATVAQAAMGHYVFVSDTDGTIQTNAANTAIANYTLTDYTVIGLATDGAVGSLILISNTQG